MKRSAMFLLFAGMCALAEAAPAPPAITIKLKSSGEGESVFVSNTNTQKEKVKFVDGNGKMVVDLNDETTTVEEYKETIVKADGDKPPIKVEREYTKGHKTKGENTEEYGLNGKAVVIEKKDGKYTFVFKNGEEITGLAAVVLTKDFGSNADLESVILPKKAVMPGDDWKMDVAALAKEFLKDDHSIVDEAKTTGTGKLLKVYTKDGKKFGEMQFKIEATLKSVGPQFADGAKFVLEMKFDVCIDGTAEMGAVKTKMSLSGTGSFANMPGSKVTVEINGETVQTKKEVDKK